MIEGLKIQISSQELKQHLLNKIKYHTDKALFYSEKVSSLKGNAEESNEMSMYNMSNNPVDSLANSANKHKAKAEYFQFIADHLVLDETYELTENDLTKLEIISMYF